MDSQKLKQHLFNLKNGTPERRLSVAEDIIPDLRQDKLRLRDKANAQCREFAATLSGWTSTETVEALRPVAIEQDLREARVVNLIAAFLTATELALTFVVALAFAVSAPFLLLVALVSIFALKVGLLALWRNPQQPQLTRRRLRRYVIAPSLALTMLALGGLMLARTAGVFVLLFAPFINLALGALSLGCLGLAAGLFALGYLLLWSAHAEKRFNALEREAVETSKVLQRAEKIAEEFRHLKLKRAVVPVRSAYQLATGGRLNRSGVMTGLVAGLVLLGSGCDSAKSKVLMTNPSSVIAAPAASAPNVTDQSLTMEIWLDWSLSAEAQPYREAVLALIAALPELGQKHGVTRVTAYHFGERGWSAPQIIQIDLPLPAALTLDETSALFGGARQQQQAQAQQQHLAVLKQKLAVLTPESLLPANVPEPPCTDIGGCLSRIFAAAPQPRKLVWLISDLADTCSHQLAPSALPVTNTALVAIILPEVPEAPDHAMRPEKLWQQRQDELLRAVPHAVAVPYFGDLPAAAVTALAHINQPK